ncbi:DNA modification methylase, partial [Enterococcus faecalis]
DIFGGTGTTMIACEQNDRQAYLMQLDPKYVDVIINRWEEFTGKEPIKLN